MGRQLLTIDWITTLLLALLGSFGLFILLTIEPSLFRQQFIFLILSLGIFIFFSRIDKIFFVWIAPIGYFFSLVMLTVTFFFPAIRGAHRWISIGWIQIQPSELVKPFVMLVTAWSIAKYPPKNIRNTVINMIIFSIPFFLVYKQPDLGTALVYVAFWFGMMLAGGLPIKTVIVGIVCAFLVAPFGWHLLAQYQKNRIITFIDPMHDPRGIGYNALQATIAVGSGQIVGRGLGQGTQSHLRFLPEYHTDFIFATLIEELGFLGGILLFILYCLLLWRVISRLLPWKGERIGFIYSLGLFFMLCVQITINTGMNMGIVPITGITLPFISLGGSSLLSLAIIFAIFVSLTRKRGADTALHRTL